MKFHNSTQLYVHSGARGNRSSRTVFGGRRTSLGAALLRVLPALAGDAVDLIGSTAALKRLGRVLLVVVPVALICNLICFSLIGTTDEEMARQAVQYQALVDKNVSLLVSRAQAFSPPNMAVLAKKLELAPSAEGQTRYWYGGRFHTRPR